MFYFDKSLNYDLFLNLTLPFTSFHSFCESIEHIYITIKMENKRYGLFLGFAIPYMKEGEGSTNYGLQPCLSIEFFIN